MVRLDTETRISPDLTTSFLLVRMEEKVPALPPTLRRWRWGESPTPEQYDQAYQERDRAGDRGAVAKKSPSLSTGTLRLDSVETAGTALHAMTPSLDPFLASTPKVSRGKDRPSRLLRIFTACSADLGVRARRAVRGCPAGLMGSCERNNQCEIGAMCSERSSAFWGCSPSQHRQECC